MNDLWMLAFIHIDLTEDNAFSLSEKLMTETIRSLLTFQREREFTVLSTMSKAPGQILHRELMEFNNIPEVV